MALTMIATLPPGVSPSVVGAGIRNTAACVSLAIVMGAFVGYRQQAIAPVVYLLIVLLFSREAGESVAAWAWPIGAGDDVAFVLVLVISAAAAAIVASRRMAYGCVDAGGRRPPA